MIRQVIDKIQEETKVSGHDIKITNDQVLAFLTNKFGKIDVLSSYSVIGNMVKMLFVAQGHTSTYTTEIKWIVSNTDFSDSVSEDLDFIFTGKLKKEATDAIYKKYKKRPEWKYPGSVPFGIAHKFKLKLSNDWTVEVDMDEDFKYWTWTQY